jgi:hypothetical protein
MGCFFIGYTFLNICIKCAFLGKLALKKQEITIKNSLNLLKTIKMDARDLFQKSQNDQWKKYNII